VEECGPCPVFASFTLAFALQLRKKHGKTSVRLRKSSVKVQYAYYQKHPHVTKPSQTHTLQNPPIHPQAHSQFYVSRLYLRVFQNFFMSLWLKRVYSPCSSETFYPEWCRCFISLFLRVQISLQYRRMGRAGELYRVIKMSLCTWWLQYRKLQVMFKVSPASLQTFIDMPNCVLEHRFQYSTVHIPNVFCDGHLQINNFVGIVIVRCTESFWSLCIHTYTHTYIHTHTQTQTHTHTHTHIYIYIYIYLQISGPDICCVLLYNVTSSDHKVSVHLMITVQKVTSNV